MMAPSYIAAIKVAAPALSVETVVIPVRDAFEIVRGVDTFAAAPNGGLVVLPAPRAAILNPIFRLTLQYRLPAIYQGLTAVAAGGLMSYGTDTTDLVRRAASYVDRLLRGTKISELPVQFPTKFNLVINLNAAKAIGLDGTKIRNASLYNRFVFIGGSHCSIVGAKLWQVGSHSDLGILTIAFEDHYPPGIRTEQIGFGAICGGIYGLTQLLLEGLLLCGNPGRQQGQSQRRERSEFENVMPLRCLRIRASGAKNYKYKKLQLAGFFEC
jgi:hypothetical protein